MKSIIINRHLEDYDYNNHKKCIDSYRTKEHLEYFEYVKWAVEEE